MRLGGLGAAVAGAGVGGLAAALALAQRGASVTIYEQAEALREVGAGLQLGPNSVAVIEALGLRDPVEAAASAPEAIEIRDHATGRLVARVPLGRAAVARYGRPYWQIHRADLLEALAAAAREAAVEIALGARVLGFEETGDGLRLALAGGGEAAADVLVAADGVRSGLREATFGGRPPRFAGHVAWRGLVPADRLQPGLPQGPCVAMGPGRHLVAYPLRDGRLWNFVAVEERAEWTEEGWSAPGDPARLRAAFPGLWPAGAALLAAVEETFVWGLFDHPPLPVWTRGRAALLGDAAHPMLPFLAQGAAMALEDAWVLAACLAAAEDPAAGLRAYEDRRRARAAQAQRAAALNGRLWHLRAPALRAAAQLALGAVSAAAPERLLARFDWLYGANVVGLAATD